MAYLLGFDIGSSSVKASLLDGETGVVVASATSPKTELPILAPQPGWAEQHPDSWWEHVKNAAAEIRSALGGDLHDVKAIGLSYQMHGLVIVDKSHAVLRPAIIWCDSRAVEIGNKAFAKIGPKKCLSRLLNSPGNFTASKLAWVKKHEPDIYKRIHKIMLPGDFIAMKMTGEIRTTSSGLSEGIFWDFIDGKPASLVLDHYGIAPELLPETVAVFSPQGYLSAGAAEELGLAPGTPVAYRGGDQPNNALSLNVLHPGEIAATAGTSGVVYGVSAKPNYDSLSRVNTFVHVNHTVKKPRYGILLCINGTGILNSWVKHTFMTVGDHGLSYKEIDALAAQAPAGADGLSILPYGNGAERTLENKNAGSSFHGLSFTRHTKAHVLRAVQEGIVFALKYGLDIMRDMGFRITAVRAGHANMFQSPLFAEAFATVAKARLELYNTDGSQGAARGAGIGAGMYADLSQAFASLKSVKTIEPNKADADAYKDAYARWREALERSTGKSR